MPLAIDDLTPLLGLAPSDPALSAYLASLSTTPPTPDIKSYPDATYHNYYPLGISLCFISNALESIDIFNPAKSKANAKYSSPQLPLVVDFAHGEIVLPPRKEGDKETRYPRDPRLEVTSSSVGRDLVRAFGEPSRKGAGGWVGVWLEWIVELKSGKAGVMLELVEDKAAPLTEQQKKQGAGGVWERAAGWPWGSFKVFRPDSTK